MDADSGFFHLTGEDPDTNDILDKIPNPDPTRSITRQFSQLSFIPPPSINPSDPGRYLLLGNLAPILPEAEVTYDLSGFWSCAGCQQGLTVLEGQVTGALNVNGPAETARLYLGDGRFNLNADVTLGKTAEITATNSASAGFDGADLTLIRSKILGGVFGDTAGEAGVIFGLSDDQGRVFSGGANGVQTP